MRLFNAVPPSGCTAEIAELDPTFSSSASFWQSPPWSRSPWNNTLYPLKWMRKAPFFSLPKWRMWTLPYKHAHTHTHTLLKQSKLTTQTNQMNNFLLHVHRCVHSHTCKSNESEQFLHVPTHFFIQRSSLCINGMISTRGLHIKKNTLSLGCVQTKIGHS